MRALAAAAVIALAVASAAAAGTSARGVNVCKLVPAKAVAAIPGVAPACVNQPPLPSPGGTDYVGNWKGKTPRSSQLQVTISKYTDQGFLKNAVRNLNQGLVAASAKRLAGVGTKAFIANGAQATEVRFAKGAYIVNVIVTALGRKTNAAERAGVVTVAKALAPRLS